MLQKNNTEKIAKTPALVTLDPAGESNDSAQPTPQERFLAYIAVLHGAYRIKNKWENGSEVFAFSVRRQLGIVFNKYFGSPSEFLQWFPELDAFVYYHYGETPQALDDLIDELEIAVILTSPEN